MDFHIIWDPARNLPRRKRKRTIYGSLSEGVADDARDFMDEKPVNEARGLALLAKVLPHMFARWRDWEDYEVLAGLPDGMITIDALAGTAAHEAAPAMRIELRIAREIRSGLMDQLVRKEIQASRILEAVVRVGMDTSQVKTDRNRIVHFDFHIASRIHAEAGVFEAAQVEEHVWHDRSERPGGSAGPDGIAP